MSDETAIEEVVLTGRAIDFAVELKTPRILAFLFADWAAITDGGKVVVAGIFERVLISEENPTPAKFSVYCKASYTYNDEVIINLYHPNGNVVARITANKPEVYPEQADSPNHVNWVIPMTIHLIEVGVYWFDVMYQEKSLGVFPLIVAERPRTDSGDGS